MEPRVISLEVADSYRPGRFLRAGVRPWVGSRPRRPPSHDWPRASNAFATS